METRWTIREQILAVSLDELKGTIEGPCPFQLLNAATLGELAIQRRIKLDGGEVVVVDTSRTHDSIMDATLQIVSAAGRPRTLSRWVRVLHEAPQVPRDVVLTRLVVRGLLSLEEAMQMGIVASELSPARSSRALRELEISVHGALHSSPSADDRTITVIALLEAGKLMPRLLGKPEACSTRARAISLIEESALARGLWEAVAEATGRFSFRVAKAPTATAVAV